MTSVLDLAGIGAGPFNLAVAALLHDQPARTRFFEARAEYAWHPGLMLPGARLQTSYLKDLVTPVDPTNPYSFLAYLVAKRRFYDFMNAEQEAISRQEFADYLAWAAARMPHVALDSPVTRVEDAGDHFQLDIRGETVRARNLCVAAGKKPHVPACCEPALSERCFHALGIARRTLDLRGKRVAVIGGGQTGAEIMLNLLDDYWGRPEKALWVTRRANFLPLDETPFTNDWFTPDYVAAFRRLPARRRAQVVGEQKLASDGISPATLKALYQRFYQLSHLDGDPDRVALLPNRELTALHAGHPQRLTMHNRLDDARECRDADVVILCTGLDESLPACMAPLADRLRRDDCGRLRLGGSFGADLEGASDRRLYLLNAGRHSHGIAEPQLSLSAWRAACVVNDLIGRRVYDTGQGDNCMAWTDPPPGLETAVA